MSEKVSWSGSCQRPDTCALTGAAAFAAGIAGAKILVNGPLWCYFYVLRYLERSEYHMAQRMQNSQPDGTAIVYGTEKCLTAALQRLQKSGGPAELLFVENSCSVSLIGDDTEGIVGSLDLDCPFVTMDCGGLSGGFAEGWSKAAVRTLSKLSSPAPTLCEKSGRPRLNLLGLTDFYFNGAADREEIVRLLELAGYEVNCVLGASSVGQLRSIASADLNVVCHEELGLEAARYLKKRYGLPYICPGLPYGCRGSVAWLEKIHAALPCAHLERVRAEAKEREERLVVWSNEMSSLWGELWFDKALVAAPGTTAHCVAQALRCEWADVGDLAMLPRQDIEHAFCDCADRWHKSGEEAALSKESGSVDEGQSLLILGSSDERMEAKRAGHSDAAFCNIAYPVSDEVLLIKEPFMGLKGSAHMQQRLWNAYIERTLAKSERAEEIFCKNLR